MFRTTRTKIIGLAMVGVVALGGAIYTTTALAVGGANASPSPARTAQTTTDPQLHAGILDMLEDHMGLSGARAEEFADEMTSRMQGFNEDFDVQEMVEQCTQHSGDGTYGSGMMGGGGMMNGTDSGYGYGVMGGTTEGYGPGMMGGTTQGYGYGMMGGTPTPNTGPSDEGTTTPNRPGPGSQETNPGFTPGRMMGAAPAAPAPDPAPSNQGYQGGDNPDGNTPTDPGLDGPQDEYFGPANGGMMGTGTGMMGTGTGMMGR